MTFSKKTLYVVTGCGISVICEQGSEGMWWVIQRIIRKGGFPTILPWTDAEAA